MESLRPAAEDDPGPGPPLDASHLANLRQSMAHLRVQVGSAGSDGKKQSPAFQERQGELVTEQASASYSPRPRPRGKNVSNNNAVKLPNISKPMRSTRISQPTAPGMQHGTSMHGQLPQMASMKAQAGGSEAISSSRMGSRSGASNASPFSARNSTMLGSARGSPATRGPSGDLSSTMQAAAMENGGSPPGAQQQTQGDPPPRPSLDGTLDDATSPPTVTDDDELTNRLLSLPNIMCRSANGDVFLVGLGDVQQMLHKRRLGQSGLKILRRFEASIQAEWDWYSWPDRDPYHEKRLERRPIVMMEGMDDGSSPLPGRAEQELSKAAAAVSIEDLDEVVRSHLEETLSKVDAHRDYLQRNSKRTLAELERQAKLKEQQEKEAKAVDFVVNRLIPEKLLNMARTRRTQRAPMGLFKRMRAKLSPVPDPYAPNDEASAKAALGGWGLAAKRVNQVGEMKFLQGWQTAIRKLKKEEASGWDELLVANKVYVKGGGGDSQGTTVYVLKCQELGVIPSTQVVMQLRMSDSNMSHCKLGRRGAQALRHALSTNTNITALNLTDNGLDAQAVTEIIAGLTSGNLALQPKARKALTDKWHALDFMKAYKKKEDMPVSVMPAALKAKLQESHDHRSTSGSGSPSAAAAAAAAAEAGEQEEDMDFDGDDKRLSIDGPIHSKPVKAPNLPIGRKPEPGEGGAKEPADSILSRVQTLELSENPLGVNGAKIVSQLLDPQCTPYQFLTELHLDKCGIPEAGGLAICRGINNGNMVLQTLSMANNQLGNKTAEAFGELLDANRTLTDLDLSWNMIKPEGVRLLCVGLEDNKSLIKLNLSWNGLENEGVMRLGNLLKKNAGLKHLDLTNTRMGSEACLVLGEGIKSNKTLEDLILNGNAVGDDGARHLMNALKQNQSLQYLGLQGSNMSSAARGHSGGADFNPLSPDGSYTLELSSQTDRAVAVQLATLDAASKLDLMKNIKLEGRNILNCKSVNWPDQMPVSGLLSCDFVTRRVQKIVTVMDQKKFMALVSQLDSRMMSDKEKLTLVEVMAPFTYLCCHQIATILTNFSMGNELVRAAALLFTRAADLEENVDKLTAHMQERDIHELHDMLGWYSYLRFSNPTGHYELNLTTGVHQALAARLKDVAYSEPAESNNWCNIIYDLYSHNQKWFANFGPPEAWKGNIPSKGTVSFDFVSGALPPEGSQPIDDEQLLDFLHHGIGILFDSAGRPVPETDMAEADMQLALLRQEVGHQFYFTCDQVKKVMDCFETGPHKVEVLVMLYALIVDPKSLWTIMYSLRSFEQALALWRLGPQNVWDRAHPSMHYVLDLNNPNHEQVARKLVELAAQNPEVPNFWNIRLQGNKKNILENRNMWGTFTAESFTPWLEFDFVGPDAWETILGKQKADFDTVHKGERLDLVTKLSKRMELQRIKDMYGYFSDGSGYAARLWQTSAQMFKPLLQKTPWLAAWDRLMRLLVRYDMRSGDIQSDSYIEDIFDESSNDEGELSAEAFEACCKAWGYTKGEIVFHYRKLFDSAAWPSPSEVAQLAKEAQQKEQNQPPPPPPAVVAALGPDMPSAPSPILQQLQQQLARNSEGGTAPAGQEQQQQQQPKGPSMVVDFATFVDVFMREPPAELRFKEVPVVNPLVVAAAANKLKGRLAKKKA